MHILDQKLIKIKKLNLCIQKLSLTVAIKSCFKYTSGLMDGWVGGGKSRLRIDYGNEKYLKFAGKNSFLEVPFIWDGS